MEHRRYCDPIVVDKDGTIHRPTRVPFDERTMQEGWLQDLLERYPELLPIEDIEPAFSSLIPIGREIGTPVGPIDNLFINPDGYITLVETKLWRNPEARRQVVAQIIDYAKEVSRWDFEQLDAQVRASARQRSQDEVRLLDIVKASGIGPQMDEARFVDRVTRNLRRGRLLLIIAGDGISESLERMADYLQQTPQLHFTLALVELVTYRLGSDDEALLVIPQVVARTRETPRAVVRVEEAAIESVRVVGVDITKEMARARPRPPTLTEEDLFDLLGENVSDHEVGVARRLLSDISDLGVEVDWKQASFSVKLPDPGGSGRRLTMLLAYKDGWLGGGWLANQLPELGLPRKIGEKYFERVAALFDDCRVKKQPSNDLAWTRGIALSELGERYDQFMGILAETIEEIKDASFPQS